MRRHPSHYLSPARANARQGKTPKPAAAAPSHHSNAPNKPESQSILSKIVAHWIDGLPPDPGRACLLLSGHWLKAARHLRFQSTISRFESSRPSHPLTQRKIVHAICTKTLQIKGFQRFCGSLQAPKRGNFRENLPKVSGQFPRYSHFRETFRGDTVRSALSGRGCSLLTSADGHL
jgi:hypothetical protein